MPKNIIISAYLKELMKFTECRISYANEMYIFQVGKLLLIGRF